MKRLSVVTTDVNHLVEICNERILGYEKAAENVKDAELKSLFMKYVDQTKKFEEELMPFSDFSDAEEAGTRPQSDTFRLWMDIKSAITAGSSTAMVNACITGEEAAIRNYEATLEDDLTPEVRTIVSRQLAEIKAACESLKLKK